MGVCPKPCWGSGVASAVFIAATEYRYAPSNHAANALIALAHVEYEYFCGVFAPLLSATTMEPAVRTLVLAAGASCPSLVFANELGSFRSQPSDCFRRGDAGPQRHPRGKSDWIEPTSD